MFEPESFTPALKVVGGQAFSIVTDFLGTPREMLDQSGHTVWSSEISVFGDVRNLSGDRPDCPFRWPGQYVDAETALSYNRFRYYDASTGFYISQDPIRLESGVYHLYLYVRDPYSLVDPFGLDWNYRLVDSNGRTYYHGRASDNQTMADVARRHSTTMGTDGSRFGPGDTMQRITDPGTPKDAVRGIEQRGTSENRLLGRGSSDVRGNKISGIADAKISTPRGQMRLHSGDQILAGRKPSEMPALAELKAKPCS
jgi:RHS repeat-associated protein